MRKFSSRRRPGGSFHHAVAAIVVAASLVETTTAFSNRQQQCLLRLQPRNNGKTTTTTTSQLNMMVPEFSTFVTAAVELSSSLTATADIAIRDISSLLTDAAADHAAAAASLTSSSIQDISSLLTATATDVRSVVEVATSSAINDVSSSLVAASTAADVVGSAAKSISESLLNDASTFLASNTAADVSPALMISTAGDAAAVFANEFSSLVTANEDVAVNEMSSMVTSMADASIVLAREMPPFLTSAADVAVNEWSSLVTATADSSMTFAEEMSSLTATTADLAVNEMSSLLTATADIAVNEMSSLTTATFDAATTLSTNPDLYVPVSIFTSSAVGSIAFLDSDHGGESTAKKEVVAATIPTAQVVIDDSVVASVSSSPSVVPNSNAVISPKTKKPAYHQYNHGGLRRLPLDLHRREVVTAESVLPSTTMKKKPTHNSRLTIFDNSPKMVSSPTLLRKNKENKATATMLFRSVRNLRLMIVNRLMNPTRKIFTKLFGFVFQLFGVLRKVGVVECQQGEDSSI